MRLQLRDMNHVPIGTTPWEGRAPAQGEYIEHAGTFYTVYGVWWPAQGGGAVALTLQRAHVKGEITVEPGFSERDDLPVDKGREPS